MVESISTKEPTVVAEIGTTIAAAQFQNSDDHAQWAAAWATDTIQHAKECYAGAIKIKARIEGLERKLQNLLQISGGRGSYNTKGTGRGPMSAAAKARIVAAQKKRWAKCRKEQGK